MHKNNFLLFFVPVMYMLFFTACSRTSDDSFEALKPLTGVWKSTGNIVVFDKWKKTSDTLLEGTRFSINRKDTLRLNTFKIVKNKEMLRFEIVRNHDKTLFFDFVKAGRKKVIFENRENRYPNKIILGFPRDSIYDYRQENSRGNMPVEFEMKRDEED